MQEIEKGAAQAFPDLEKDDIACLAGFMELLQIDAGKTLFMAGDFSDAMFVLLEGSLAVSMETGFNGKSQVIALLHPFAPVGEGSLTGRDTRGATVKAVESASVLKLEKRSFQKFAAEKPAAALRLLQALFFKSSIRLEKCSERLVHVL